MSEPGEIPRPTALELLRAEQNAIADRERDAFLARNLFHIPTAFRPDAGEFLEEVKRAFLTQKEGKNMGELFALAIQEPYLGVINVVELGVSRHPENEGELDAIDTQYDDFKRKLKDKKIIEGEVERAESGRKLEIGKSEVLDDLLVLTLTRKLIDAQTDAPVTLHDGEEAAEQLIPVPVRFQVAKQTTFAIPAKLYHAVAARFDDPYLRKESSLSIVEGLLAPGSEFVEPIRTSYYLGTELTTAG